MSRKYFGTDGIRGMVGESPMAADFVLRLGWAAGTVLAAEVAAADAGRQTRGKVLIGKDTRVSGYMFESALEAGLSSAGVDVELLGPLPTPGVAALVREQQADAGIVISASHNPYHDNGIKFFGPDGRKLLDEVELRIEEQLAGIFSTVSSDKLGKAHRLADAVERYVDFCRTSVPADFSLQGMTIAFDGANGAGYQAGPRLLESFGARVVTTGCSPDGLNINLNCGSTHPETLVELVRSSGADVGVALDGDGDRLIMTDAKGRLYDGDELLYVIASRRQAEGSLQGPVVGTLMTNLAIEQALTGKGMEFHRAKVGDRYVMEMLDQYGGQIGGEGSGHLICLDKHSTGDGLIAALQVLDAMRAANSGLDGILDGVSKFPQTLVNVRVTEKPPLDHADIQAAVSAAEQRLAGAGRVLLRPSGTEPVIRVMVEGADEQLVGQLAKDLAKVVENAASR